MSWSKHRSFYSDRVLSCERDTFRATGNNFGILSLALASAVVKNAGAVFARRRHLLGPVGCLCEWLGRGGERWRQSRDKADYRPGISDADEDPVADDDGRSPHLALASRRIQTDYAGVRLRPALPALEIHANEAILQAGDHDLRTGQDRR